MPKTIGLFAISASPYHIGHQATVNRAAGENDLLVLFVSTSDRKRKGEHVISGDSKTRAWNIVKKTLPGNVAVELGGSPVRKLWELLASHEEAGDAETEFRIYGCDDVADRFNDDSLRKYVPGLRQRDQITLVPVNRTFSGTAMREYLANGDYNAFIKGLPDGLTTGDKKALWGIFSGCNDYEVLKSYVSEVVSKR